MMDVKNEVPKAYDRIQSYVRKTPLEFSIAFSKMTNTNVYLKYENIQYTGSFKVRGAINKLLSLTPDQKTQKIVTASSGNHGAAVAYGLHKLKLNGEVFVPENASAAKVKNIQNYQVPVKFFGTDCLQTELHAMHYAKENNCIYISPYNDIHVIAGQGTIAIEISQKMSAIDAIFVPIGGGGLISGIAGFIKSISPQTRMIGCLPENSPVMAESIKAGKIIDMETQETLSDATAGGIAPNSITFEICQKFVDEYILVSENEIKSAIVSSLENQHILIEGAAAVALASFFKTAPDYKNKNVIIILSGANISLAMLKKILAS